MSTKLKLQSQSVFTTLLIGACGALVAWWLGVPAPFLTGPAAVVSIAGLFGVNCTIPIPLRNACFIAIGLALGSSVTPEILSAASAWPVSLIGMCVSVSIVMLSGGLMFQRVFGIERKTALLASSPGHLSYVIGYSADIQADTAIISVIQSMRVLILTLAVPVAVAIFDRCRYGDATSAGYSPVIGFARFSRRFFRGVGRFS